MDFGHGAERLCEERFESGLGDLSWAIGAALLVCVAAGFLALCVKEKFDFKKILGMFF